MRGLTRFALLTVLSLASVGCRHRLTVAKIVVPAATPVPLAKGPDEPPAVVASVPPVPIPVPTVVVAPKKVKKPRKKVVVPPPASSSPAPVQVASAGPAPSAGESVIGELTAGGSQEQQKATELIAALDKRLANLSGALQEAQREQIVRVRYFSTQAKAAFYAGDADGAVTLAVKGKLLLDEVLK